MRRDRSTAPISAATLTDTMLAPVGRFQTKDRASPAAKQISEMQADVTTSARKLLTSLRAVTAGRMI